MMKLLLSLTLFFNFAFATLDDDIKTFVKDFKSKRNEAKYYKELQSLKKLDKEKLNKILKRYKQTIKLINPNNIPEDKLTQKLQKSLDNNVYYIYKFYKEVYRAKGKAEHIAIKHEKKVPELKGSRIIEIEKKEGQIADLKYKIALAKVKAKVKILDNDIKQLDEESKQLDEDLKDWTNFLGKISKLVDK